MKEHLINTALSVAAAFGLMQATSSQSPRELEVDRLVVRKELIVSDTGQPWEEGFEEHRIARGLYARSLSEGPRAAGLWVRGRLIKTEIDDPFDDRFHAIQSDGTMTRMPGHISWNVWIDGNWRQMAIVQGEAMEYSEWPLEQWTGGSHPGRLRFQTFRPLFSEPVTDAVIGQGMMSLGGGGFGGDGLPYPSHVLELWGGVAVEKAMTTPAALAVMDDDGSGEHQYAIIAIGPEGDRTPASAPVKANGRAKLRWDRVHGAETYIILRDGREVAGPLRIDGAQKEWTDPERG